MLQKYCIFGLSPGDYTKLKKKCFKLNSVFVKVQILNYVLRHFVEDKSST